MYTILVATYTSCGGSRILARSNLDGDHFRARVGNRGASLFMLGGGGGVRIYVAGCNNHVISIVIPSGSKVVESMMLNFSSVRSCVGCPSSFKTDVKHCTGHVGRKHFSLSKVMCRLPQGGCKRYLRKNPRKFRCHVCENVRIDSERIGLACLSGGNRRNFPKGLGYAVVVGLASSGTVSVRCRTRASGPAIMGVAGRSCFGLSKSPSGSGSSCLLALGTSCCAPISDAFVAAKRVIPIRNAPVSFELPTIVKAHVGRSFRRLECKGNVSRG